MSDLWAIAATKRAREARVVHTDLIHIPHSHALSTPASCTRLMQTPHPQVPGSRDLATDELPETLEAAAVVDELALSSGTIAPAQASIDQTWEFTARHPTAFTAVADSAHVVTKSNMYAHAVTRRALTPAMA